VATHPPPRTTIHLVIRRMMVRVTGAMDRDRDTGRGIVRAGVLVDSLLARGVCGRDLGGGKR